MTSFVSAKEVKTLEHYGASLLTGMISLKTLEAFHEEALKKGLLDTDEQELAKSITWEIKRLLNYYSKQLQRIMDRCPLESDKILAELQAQSLTAAQQIVKKSKPKTPGRKR